MIWNVNTDFRTVLTRQADTDQDNREILLQGMN